MSLPIIESNTSKSDLNRVSASSATVSKKITLGKALTIATLALAVIALLYAEVKYGIVSYCIAYAIANPWIIGAIAIAGIIGVAYLLYRNAKRASANQQNENINIPPTAIATTLTTQSRSVDPDAMPASIEDLNAAILSDPALIDYLRKQIRRASPDPLSLEAARMLVHRRLQQLDQAARALEAIELDVDLENRTNMYITSANQAALKFVEARPLALRWLMTAQ